ncbi:MAG: VOC family protein [Patescibacteria group bacterium]|nr:VOC family protein [Patescibacteria group bacterium]
MNRVVHFEIQAKDADKIQKFYQDVFGWEITNAGAEYGGYRMVKTGEPVPKDMASVGINGGISPRMSDLPAAGGGINAFVCIIGVDDIDACIKKILAAGGTEQVAKTDVPHVGLLAYYKDPEGTIFGILQPSSEMAGAK